MRATEQAATSRTLAAASDWQAWLAALAMIFVLTSTPAGGAENTIHPAHLSDANLTEVKNSVGAGADVNAKHIAGGTALHHLVTVSAQMGMSGLMIRNNTIVRPGQWQLTGHEAIAAYLVENGADIGARDGDGKTPLHVAALTGHAAAARFLIDHGADVNARDTGGRTPLAWARWSASDEAIRELAAATGTRIDPRGVRRRADAVIEVLQAAGARD